ncbi:MAG: HAMP domain-containing histidine kinase [Elusimicrobia bacterium]|nr:HAMP domain-containing histidine kinase [Elusimicrobiota bacterium]
MDKGERELLRRAASVIGHDLRNPLAVINNSSYFVRAKLGGAGLDPKVEKHLKIIESEIARADGLLADMLAFSRPYEPAAETMPLDPVVKDAVAGFPKPAGGKVDLKLGAEGSCARFDGKAIADALRRLIDNAFAAQGEKGAVKVATSAGKEGLSVSVTDVGPGIAPEIKAELYEAFTTTKPKGLGLGLALARKYVEGNGGALTHATGPKGSTFRLTLPKAHPGV